MDAAAAMGMNRMLNQYVRASGTRCVLLCMVLCVAYALLTPCLAWGANITWDDSQPVPSSLQPTDESNNTVTVTFNNPNTTVNMNVYGSKDTPTSANGNVVTITGTGTITGKVVASASQSDMTNNTLTVTGTTLNVVDGAMTAQNGTAQNNTVTLTNVKVVAAGLRSGSVSGASTAGLAKENTVTITGSTIQGWLSAGQGGGVQGKAEGNILHIKDSAVQNAIAGAGTISAADNTLTFEGNSTAFLYLVAGEGKTGGTATGNALIIHGGTVQGEVGGGRAGLNAANNSVEISGGTLHDLVYGGKSTTADATGNSVKISGGTLSNVVYGGHASKAAQGNTIEFSGGSVRSLTGGQSTTAEATGNVVMMTGGTATFEVHGGRGVTGTTDNKVEFSGGTVKEGVYGGTNQGAGSALRNTVIVSGTAIAEKGVIGGVSNGGTVESNTVIVRDTADADSAVGGSAFGHDAKNNTVEMTGGKAQFLIGGDSNNAQATGNVVRMTSGTVSVDVRGAQGDTGATDNLVDLSGGTVEGNVRGGLNRRAGSALRNTVLLADAIIVKGNVYGGSSQGLGNNGGTAENNTVSLGGNARVDGGVVGGFSQDHEAKSNMVQMTGGSAVSLAGGESRTANATGNTVQMSAGSVTGDVRGGAGSTGAMDNTVLLSGGDVAGALYGGLSTGTGNAAGNTVTMTGGTVTAHVAGGQSETGAATGNIVNIHGGTLGAAVYGGYATGAGTATDNVLNLYGSPDLSASTLYGGMAGGEARSGNTLNVHTSNLVAKNVVNFAKYNFILPDYVRPGDTVLNLTGSDPTLVGNAEVGVGKVGGGMLMQPGDRIFLLRNDGGGVQAEGMLSHNIRGQHGVAVEYDFTVRATDNTVEIYLDPANDPVRIRPEMKALPEAWVATLALINQGAELATRSAVATAQSRKEDPWGLQVFGVMAGASARYNTGSHVDLSGTNMVMGVSKALPVKNAHVLLGVFVEAGFARYQTYNGFSDRPSVTARGNNRYLGGGLLAHASQMVKDSAGARRSRGVYAETSLRAGRMDMDFASSDLRDVAGSQATYTASTPYFGAHVGTGYVWDIGESTTAEVYGQVYWTHLKGNKFSVLGDPVTVEDVNSWRLRGGARINHAWNAHVSGYVGVGYEHSFDGQVKARAYHLRIPTPQLQGGSGLAEAGLHLTPKEGSGFSADISVQGAMGHKQSLGGEVTMRYEF